VPVPPESGSGVAVNIMLHPSQLPQRLLFPVGSITLGIEKSA